MNRFSELSNINRVERQTRKSYSYLLDRHFSFLLDWYTILDKHWFSDIAFLRNEPTDFVYVKAEIVARTPCLLIDTPKGTYLFYFYLTVGKKKAFVYEVDLLSKNNKSYQFIINCIKNDDFNLITPIFTFNGLGIIIEYPVNYHYFDFIKYLINFEVPISKDSIRKLTRTTDLEQYFLLRFNKII